jgi:Hypervirulence associated proteins TUDOR domain
VQEFGLILHSKGGFPPMTQFKVGDHVRWNSEAGYVTGKIVKVHKKDTDYKGYTHHATIDNPQYEIQSDKSDHVAMHKGTALQRIG